MSEPQGLFHHILVPTDGSEASVAAGRLAIRLAAFHHARITFVYVVDASVVDQLAGASGRVAEEVRNELLATGERYVDYLTRLATEAGLKAERVLRSGVPHDEIERLTRGSQVDLIVMGRVGRRGLRRILIGSVTERVIEYASCPVLVVSKNS
jgi:nucleotide-binding universal stress UspA family protein